MSDPRLNGEHLNLFRRDQYDAAVDELLDARGPLTAEFDPLARPKHPPPGGTYYLVTGPDGPHYALRVGITGSSLMNVPHQSTAGRVVLRRLLLASQISHATPDHLPGMTGTLAEHGPR